MNRRMVCNMIGRIIRLEAGLLLLPAVVAAIYGEKSLLAFLFTAIAAGAVGSLIVLLSRTRDQVIFAKEGFVIVALAWLAMSAIGAVPFVISGDIPSYVDAFFETVSGFTTTGSSVLDGTAIDTMSHAGLFWRSFSHWIGGMGVLVLITAIIPSASGRTMHILRAEMPGPIVGKLVPRARDTAKILYYIYFGMTVAEIILLLCGGEMNLFESVVYSFGTAGTGGFAPNSAGMAAFGGYTQWVVTVFMMLFGVNFNLYYLMLLGRFRSALRSRELLVYLAIILTAGTIVTVNVFSMFDGIGEAVRTAFFQVVSIVTTTGYSTADFGLWPSLSRGILFMLMFVGGCAGSTAGGLKVSRILLMTGTVRCDLRRMLHPRSVSVVRLEGKRVDNVTINAVGAYFIVYCLLLAVIFLLISFEPYGIECNFSAVVTCLNNVGPGFGMVGPAGNFGAYTGFSKIMLSMAMLFGRLEIYPLLIALIPSTWTKK